MCIFYLALWPCVYNKLFAFGICKCNMVMRLTFVSTEINFFFMVWLLYSSFVLSDGFISEWIKPSKSIIYQFSFTINFNRCSLSFILSFQFNKLWQFDLNFPTCIAIIKEISRQFPSLLSPLNPAGGSSVWKNFYLL